MAINRTLRFQRRTAERGFLNECAICGRKRVGEKGVAAVFIQDEPPVYAAVYCFKCIDGLVQACGGALALEMRAFAHRVLRKGRKSKR